MRGSLYLTRPVLADYIANPDGRGELVGELKQLLFRHKVLFFRDQDLSPADHVLFAERFGQLGTHPLAPGHPGQPKLVVLQRQRARSADNIWHSDLSWPQDPEDIVKLNAYVTDRAHY